MQAPRAPRRTRKVERLVDVCDVGHAVHAVRALRVHLQPQRGRREGRQGGDVGRQEQPSVLAAGTARSLHLCKAGAGWCRLHGVLACVPQAGISSGLDSAAAARDGCVANPPGGLLE